MGLSLLQICFVVSYISKIVIKKQMFLKDYFVFLIKTKQNKKNSTTLK